MKETKEEKLLKLVRDHYKTELFPILAFLLTASIAITQIEIVGVRMVLGGFILICVFASIKTFLDYWKVTNQLKNLYSN